MRDKEISTVSFKEKKALLNKILTTKSLSKLYSIIEFELKAESTFNFLYRAIIYAKTKNIMRANLILKRIISENIFKNISENREKLSLSVSQEIKITFDLLDYLKVKTQNSIEFQALLFYFYESTKGQFKIELGKRYRVRTSVSYIRRNFIENQNTKNLASLFGKFLYLKSSEEELYKYLNLIDFKEKTKNKNFFEALEILELLESVPRDLANQKDLMEIFTFLREKKRSIYETALYVKLITSPRFYSFIKSHSKKTIGLAINEERKLYKSVLEKPHAKDYGRFHLLRIGDEANYD